MRTNPDPINNVFKMLTCEKPLLYPCKVAVTLLTSFIHVYQNLKTRYVLVRSSLLGKGIRKHHNFIEGDFPGNLVVSAEKGRPFSKTFSIIFAVVKGSITK